MLIVKLQINNTKVIRIIGIHNIGPSMFTDEHLYDVYIADDFGKFSIGSPFGKIRHNRSDGAEALAAKALNFIIGELK